MVFCRRSSFNILHFCAALLAAALTATCSDDPTTKPRIVDLTTKPQAADDIGSEDTADSPEPEDIPESPELVDPTLVDEPQFELRGKGKLAAHKIQKTMNTKGKDTAFCFSSARRTQPNLRGTLTMVIKVNKTGKVGYARVKSSTLDSPELENCMADRIKKWRFAKPKGGSVYITKPFLFGD